MDSVRLKAWQAQLEVLVAEDEGNLREAELRRQALTLELEAVHRHAELSAGMARSSHHVLEKVRMRIRQLAEESGEPHGHSSSPPPPPDPNGRAQRTPLSVSSLILAFLGERDEATYGEITEQVRRMRPDVRAENCARDLGRLVQRGTLMRPRTGVYRRVPTESEPMKD